MIYFIPPPSSQSLLKLLHNFNWLPFCSHVAISYGDAKQLGDLPIGKKNCFFKFSWLLFIHQRNFSSQLHRFISTLLFAFNREKKNFQFNFRFQVQLPTRRFKEKDFKLLYTYIFSIYVIYIIPTTFGLIHSKPQVSKFKQRVSLHVWYGCQLQVIFKWKKKLKK